MQEWKNHWNRFWFAPLEPHTLGFLRICTGLMMAYMHAVWLWAARDFLGPDAWLDKETIRQLHSLDFKWSYLWYFDRIEWIWIHQWLAIIVTLCMAVGLFTRVTSALGWLMMLMVCHRMTGTLFGLDQVVMMLSMYLMLSDCGSVYSLDRKFFAGAGQSRWWLAKPGPTGRNRIATRLLQLHLCVVYLFGGISKLRGEMWWDGSALWFAAASYEYQSIDLTWIGHFPLVIALLTHVTIFWETFYCALIWPRLTRPWTLAMAILVHGGIAMFLGMITFGTMMIVANLSFVEPATMRRIFQAVQRWRGQASSSTEPQSAPNHR